MLLCELLSTVSTRPDVSTEVFESDSDEEINSSDSIVKVTMV